MRQDSLLLRLLAVVVLILIPLTACGIRPNKTPDRDIVGTLESDTQIELVSDFTGPESVEPVTIPETGAPIETASPITVPETVYSEETSAETDPSAIGSLPDYSHIWEFKPDLPEFYSKYSIPVEFFLSDLSIAEFEKCDRNQTYRVEHYYYTDPSATFPDGSPLPLPIFSNLAEPQFIKEHTVDFYLVQNKQSGSYLTNEGTARYLTDPDHYDGHDHYMIGLYGQDLSNTNMAGAQIVRIVQLDDGCYAMYFSFYAKSPVTDTVSLPCFSTYTGVELTISMQWQIPHQTMLIRKTSSGAFRITSLYRDAVKIQRIEKDHEGKYVNKSFFGTLVEYDWLGGGELARRISMEILPYTPDTDYSDEWLFIPVKGSPEFNP